MTYVYDYSSPIGALTIASDGESITGLWMAEQKYYGQTLEQDAAKEHVPVFEQAAAWLDQYFAGGKIPVEFPLAPKGSAFRQEVWKILRAIPHGEVTTYKAIAKSIAEVYGRLSMSAQAVGGAVGHNPISIIIPCHRVVGSDGDLTGFAGGVEKKKWLLRLEKADMSAWPMRRTPESAMTRGVSARSLTARLNEKSNSLSPLIGRSLREGQGWS
jgi:methylated-DNA-[protein]-cysteine S-methyltransferase